MRIIWEFIGNDRHTTSAEAARGYDRTAHALKVINNKGHSCTAGRKIMNTRTKS